MSDLSFLHLVGPYIRDVGMYLLSFPHLALGCVVDTTEELSPSFCNGLGTMNIVSFQGRTINLTSRDMSLEFRYILG